MGAKIGGDEAVRRGGWNKEREGERQRVRKREHQVYPKKALNTSSSEPL